MQKRGSRERYIHAFDGLRAFAVLSVILYHLNIGLAQGGFLGVDIFFVLSGYLITSIILPPKGKRPKVNLRMFWVRRIRRLIPAVYIMIMVIVLWVGLFKQDLLTKVQGDALSSFLYSSNWWFIFHKLSYFDSFGSPSPLKNLWSLAIEEQFYILWPIILVIGLTLFKKRSIFLMSVLMGAICSAVLMGMLYQPGLDPSRIYYGTDTRSFELLIGCLLAMVWPMKKFKPNIPAKTKRVLDITSMIAFVIFLLSIGFISEYQPFLYRGGMFVFCINAGLLIACVSHPSSFLGQLLSWKPLRYLGTRSYGLYLWHYPIIVLTTPIQEIGNPVFWHIGLQLALIIIIAEVSYRFIETPIRQYGFRGFLQQIPTSFLKWRRLSIARKTSVMLTLVILVIFTIDIKSLVENNGVKKTPEHHVSVVKVRPPTVQAVSQISMLVGTKSEATTNDDGERKTQTPILARHDEPIQPQGKKSTPNQNGVIDKKESNESTVKTTDNTPRKKMLAIGDSVMVDISRSLQRRYPNITIDARIGRQLREAVQLAPHYAAFNRSNAVVIIELGTNGFFENKQIDTLLHDFSNAHIYLVNTRVPRTWEGEVNQALSKKAKEYKNITLVDWHALALKHPDYFAADGVHLVPKGVTALTRLIQQAIR